MPSTAAVSSAFLSWVVQQGDQAESAKFLGDDASLIDGRQATTEELDSAIQQLVNDGLIELKGTWQNSKLRVRPTANGRRRVSEFDG